MSGCLLESSEIEEVTRRSWVICFPIVVRKVVRVLPSKTGSIWNRSSLKMRWVPRVSGLVTAPETMPPAADTIWLEVCVGLRVSGGEPLRTRPRIWSFESGGFDVKLAFTRGQVPTSVTTRS